MAEESPQNSSKPQEASKDSGASSEGQLSNPTGENTVEQNNQKSQTVTNQNSQSNKRYDLGVLFVHGIGFQKQGDIFNEIYPAIANEIKLDKSIVYNEVPSSYAKEKRVRIVSNGKIKNILFRESYWHGQVGSSGYIRGNNSSKGIDILLCLSWCIRILCLKFSQVRIGTPLFFASVLSIAIFLSNNINIFTDIIHAAENEMMPRVAVVMFISAIVVATIFIVCYMNLLSIENEDGQDSDICRILNYSFAFDRLKIYYLVTFMLYLVCSVVYVLWGQVTYVILLVLGALFILVRFLWGSVTPKIVGLWYQINACADYIRSNQGLTYLNRVQSDLDRILHESNRVIVVSHSMGEYLSYKVLSREKYRNLSNIDLISIGGGLGAVSLIGNSRISDADGNYLPQETLRVSSGVAVASILNLLLFVVSWLHLFVDLWSIYKNFQNAPFNEILFSLIDILCIAISYFVSRDIIRFGGVIDHTSNFKFYRYTHFFDPVGNFSNFVYGSNVSKDITPRLGFGHGVSSYFFGASREGSPGNVEDTKFISMKYMQYQLVQHIKYSLHMIPCFKNFTESIDSKWHRDFQKITYIALSSIVVVLLEWAGILFGLMIYNWYHATNYAIEDYGKYIIAIGILEYWGVRFACRVSNLICAIYHPGDRKHKVIGLVVSILFSSFVIGLLATLIKYSMFDYLISVPHVKSL